MMVEEIVHFMTQFGWSELYPVQFGVNGWSSVIAKETQAALTGGNIRKMIAPAAQPNTQAIAQTHLRRR